MSSLTSLTIKQPRIRHTTSKSAPTTAAQRKEKAAKREENQEEMNAAIIEWFDDTMAKANHIAEKFNKKPRHILDIFFHGGARMVNAHEKVNPYCAFLSLKSQELRDGKQLVHWYILLQLTTIFAKRVPLCRCPTSRKSSHPNIMPWAKKNDRKLWRSTKRTRPARGPYDTLYLEAVFRMLATSSAI